jgi:SAM-dependent methyltransferase
VARTASARSKRRLGDERRPAPAASLYGTVAQVYDRVYAWKDYVREARRIRTLVRAEGPPGARTLLDVGCGTGGHLRHLVRDFECTGLDSSPEMLAAARKNAPGARFVRGAMPSFDLGKRYDVVLCLFSAIGYVRTEPALRRTLRTFARHLAPGGILLVEPWLTPEAWTPGSMHLLTVESPEAPIARMNGSVTVRGRSVMEMHYLAGVDGEVRHWIERHDMGLFSPRAMTDAFRAAGLRVRRIRSRFYHRPRPDRGLYVGRRPR